MAATYSPDILRRRQLLLAAAVLSTLLTAILTMSLWFGVGTFGVELSPSGVPFVDVVDQVTPGLPASNAGIRIGDTIDVRDLTSGDRLRWRSGPHLDDTIDVPIRRGSERLRTRVTAVPFSQSPFFKADGWDQVLSDFGFLIATLVSILLVWRRPESIEALLLAGLLIVSDLTNAVSNAAYWVSPWPNLDIALYTFSDVSPLASALFVAYTMQFGRPASRPRRTLAWSYYALTTAYLIASVAGTVGEWLGLLDSTTWLFAQPLCAVPVDIIEGVAPLVCAGLALRDATREERARLAWATGSISLIQIFAMVYSVAGALGHPNHVEVIAVDVATFVTPLGLAYALLNRRLLDVGFVLSRTAVFTTITLLVLSTFTLVEWALGTWLQSASKTTNLVVSAVLALCLGLSIHPLHSGVDHVIDRVFFRKRHDDERALRRAAHEAAFLTDPTTLLARTEREVVVHTGATFAGILLYDGSGHYGNVDENDSALVTLRTFNEPLDLVGVDTALNGERAYPMMARGRLIAVLLLGPKATGEAYAPDESALLLELARGVAGALDLHDVGREEAVKGVVAAIEGLTRAIGELPDAIAKRLEKA